MDDDFAAATVNFDETPIVTWEAYDYDHTSRRSPLSDSSPTLARAQPGLQHHFATMEQQTDASVAGYVGLPGHRDHVLRRHVRRLHDLSLHVLRHRGWKAASTWTSGGEPSTLQFCSAAV